MEALVVTESSQRASLASGVTALLALVAYLPLVSEHLLRLCRSATHGAAVLILAYAAWMWWSDLRRRRLRDFGRRSVWCLERLDVSGAWPALVLLYVSLLVWSPWLAMFSAAVLLTRPLLWRRAPRGRRHRWQWIVWLLLPLPLHLDQALSQFLQQTSSQVGSHLLDRLHVDHLLTGHIFELAARRFWVDEACSGVRSLYATLVVTALWSCSRQLPPLRIVGLVIAALVWCTAMNAVRLAVCMVAESRAFLPLASSPWHELLGGVCFLLTLLLIWSTNEVADTCRDWHRNSADEADWASYFDDARTPSAARIRMVPGTAPRRRWQRTTVGLWFMASVLSLATNGWSSESLHHQPTSAPFTIPEPAPRTWSSHGWTLNRMVSDAADRHLERGLPAGRLAADGQQEQLWEVRDAHDQHRGWWIVTGPYSLWHDVDDCYRARGWKRTLRERRSNPGLNLNFTRLVLENDAQQQATVHHVMWSQDGRTIPPVDDWSWESVRRSLVSRLWHTDWARRPDRRLLQGVLFIELSREERDVLQAARELDGLLSECLRRSGALVAGKERKPLNPEDAHEHQTAIP